MIHGYWLFDKHSAGLEMSKLIYISQIIWPGCNNSQHLINLFSQSQLKISIECFLKQIFGNMTDLYDCQRKRPASQFPNWLVPHSVVSL